MGKGNFSDEFKRDAVAQITERGYPIAELSQRVGVSAHSLYALKVRQLCNWSVIAMLVELFGVCPMLSWPSLNPM